jgi:hypothetical protein
MTAHARRPTVGKCGSADKQRFANGWIPLNGKTDLRLQHEHKGKQYPVENNQSGNSLSEHSLYLLIG